MIQFARRSIPRRLLRWAFLLFLTYLGLIVVFLFLERRLVFVPSSAEEAWLKPEDPRSEDVSVPPADGNTILLVTHDEDVARRARRIIRIRDGKIEADRDNP